MKWDFLLRLKTMSTMSEHTTDVRLQLNRWLSHSGSLPWKSLRSLQSRQLRQVSLSSFQGHLIRHIYTGLRISVTGVFQDSYGGDIESRHITAMIAARW